MITTPSATSVITAELVNPILVATRHVFETALGCSPVRTGLALHRDPGDQREISAVIGMSGQLAGTIVLGLGQETARNLFERMLGERPERVDRNVCDAVGEITNMIAGQTKAQLAGYDLSLSIPNVVAGEDHVVHYPNEVVPMQITFDSDIGPFTVEVGFSKLPAAPDDR